MQVRDAAFLHRYSEPVLLVLHETQPTWAGLYAERKDTMCLTAFSLNLAHQKHLRLWHTVGLPSDAHKLLPVPLGGVLVLGQSLILYHAQVGDPVPAGGHPCCACLLQQQPADASVCCRESRALWQSAARPTRVSPRPSWTSTPCANPPPRPQPATPTSLQPMWSR